MKKKGKNDPLSLGERIKTETDWGFPKKERTQSDNEFAFVNKAFSNVKSWDLNLSKENLKNKSFGERALIGMRVGAIIIIAVVFARAIWTIVV